MYHATPGSRSPGRVPIGNRAAGVNPMLVSMLLPSRTAARLAPLPRWARISAAQFFHEAGVGQAVETVALYSHRVEAARDGQQSRNPRHSAVKRRVKAGDLKQLRGALAERFDQFNFNGQMVRIVRADAMHLIQHFLRDTLGLVVVHGEITPASPTAFTDSKPVLAASQSIRKAAADR